MVAAVPTEDMSSAKLDSAIALRQARGTYCRECDVRAKSGSIFRRDVTLGE